MHPRSVRIPFAQPSDKVLLDESPIPSDLGARKGAMHRVSAQGARMDAEELGGLFEAKKRGIGHRGYAAALAGFSIFTNSRSPSINAASIAGISSATRSSAP